MRKAQSTPDLDAADAPRCSARTREGLCPEPPEAGRRRCRRHGGAAGVGAPSGPRNGRFVEGNHTKEAQRERRWVREVLKGWGNGMDDLQGKNSLAPAPTGKRRVGALVYKDANSVQYLARSPVGEERAAWRRELKAALGTSSAAFVDAALARLLAASTLPNNMVPTSTSVAAALALVQSMEPANELQAALAVDVACLHAASTNMLSRLSSHIPESRMRTASNAAARLERAFHSAVQTYQKLKHGNRQVIRIERIEVKEGSQAMIKVG